MTEQYTFTLQSNVKFPVKRAQPLWIFHLGPEKLVESMLSCFPAEWNCKSLFILTEVQRCRDRKASGAHRNLLLCAVTCKLLDSSKEGFKVGTTCAWEAKMYRCFAWFLLPAANSTWCVFVVIVVSNLKVKNKVVTKDYRMSSSLRSAWRKTGQLKKQSI